MQRQSARKHQQEMILSSNQLCTRTRQPRLHIVPRHLRQHQDHAASIEMFTKRKRNSSTEA